MSNAPVYEFEGTVKVIKHTETKNDRVDSDETSVTVKNSMGDAVVIKGTTQDIGKLFKKKQELKVVFYDANDKL